jgi:hypothetical protein
MPTHGLSEKDFVEARQLYLAAEAVYAQVLGAYYQYLKDPNLHESAYGDSRDVFSWYGACRHLCLLEGIRGLKPKNLGNQP